MENIVARINIDLHSPAVYEVVKAQQNDTNSRIIEVVLTNNGKPYPLNEVSTIKFGGHRSDGSSFIQDCTYTDDLIEIVLKEDILSLHGLCEGRISLYDSANNQILSTPTIKISVQKDPCFDKDNITEIPRNKIDETILEIGSYEEKLNQHIANADIHFTKDEIDNVGGAEPVASVVNGLNPILENSTDAPIISFKGYGKTIGEIYTGKNLLNTGSLTEKNYNGVIYTPVYKNGLLQYINTDGTATAGSAQLRVYITLPAGDYIFNGCPDGGEKTTGHFVFLFYDNNPNNYIYPIDSNDYPFTLEKESQVAVGLCIGGSLTVSNLKFYPMIRLATETDPTYEPYIEDLDSVNTGRGIGESYNLLDIPTNLNVEGYNYNYDFTATVNKDKSITFNGSTSSSNTRIILNMVDLNTNVFPEGIYLASGGNSKAKLNIVADSVDLASNYSGETEFIISGTTHNYAYISIPPNSVFNNETYYFMVRDSDVVNSEYKTYGQHSISIKMTNEDGTESNIVNIPLSTPLYDGDYICYNMDGSGEVVSKNESITPLTEEQIAEFEKLRTFDGVTYVTCEAESEITYFKNNANGKTVAMISDDLDKKIEKNQNAFSNVTIGGTTISADIPTDTLTLIAGDNMTITPDLDGNQITISSTGGSTGITITEAEYLAKKDEYDADGNAYFVSDGHDGLTAKDMPFDDTITKLGVNNVQDGIVSVNNTALSALNKANSKADYEEGTCTLYVAKFDASSYIANKLETKTVTANYIKSGKLVYVTLKPTSISFSNTAEGYVAVSGVPFQPADNSNVIGIWGISKAPVGRYGFVTYTSTGNSPNMMNMGIGNEYAKPPSITSSVQLTIDIIYRIA